MLRFPLLALSLVLFSLVNLTGSGAARPWYTSEALAIPLMSGDLWHVTGGHVFLLFSMILLFMEIVRATSSARESLVNHAFSVCVFIIAISLFLMHEGYGNSTFFIFTMMTALDFLAGFIITTVAARRDMSFPRFRFRR